MSKSFRIKTTSGSTDNHFITCKLDQSFDFLEILSLKLQQEDIYRTFNSNYGCLIGRVIGGGGTGIPNAKISIFIPIDSIDQSNPDIVSIYPFLTTRDLGSDNKKYNLLPRVSTFNKINGWLLNNIGVGISPKVPIGSFPTKEELLINKTYLEVYKKYYKFTTTTNESGDYMLFGIPVGQQEVVFNVDLTDIGQFSMSPSTMSKNLGFPKDLFDEDGTKIKKQDDLDTLPNVQTQTVNVDVKPFWGDTTIPNIEIGITRQDFKIRGEIIPNFVIGGAAFSMAENAYYGDKILFRVTITNKLLISIPQIKILGNVLFAGKDINIPKFDVQNHIQKKYCDINGGHYDQSSISFKFDYHPFTNPSDGTTSDTDNGDGLETNKLDLNVHRNLPIDIQVFTFVPNVDPNSISNVNTDVILLSDNKYVKYIDNGQFALSIPCNSRRMITDEHGNLIDSNDPNKGIYTEFNGYIIIRMPDGEIENPPGSNQSARVFMKIPQSTAYNKGDNGLQWVGNHHTFQAGKIYNVSQFYFTKNKSNFWENTGIIKDVNDSVIPQNFRMIANQGNNFGGDWVIGCLYFIQYMYKIKKNENDRFCPDIVSYVDSDDASFSLGGGIFNIRHLLRGDLFPTKFIEISKDDYLKIVNHCDHGFRSNSIGLAGTYPSQYFFKGLFNADGFKYLYEKGLL